MSAVDNAFHGRSEGMPSAFIHYSHHDRGFVQRLARDLQDDGVDVWWDQEDVRCHLGVAAPHAVDHNLAAFLTPDAFQDVEAVHLQCLPDILSISIPQELYRMFWTLHSTHALVQPALQDNVQRARQSTVRQE
jgi:hypothetical protein